MSGCGVMQKNVERKQADTRGGNGSSNEFTGRSIIEKLQKSQTTEDRYTNRLSALKLITQKRKALMRDVDSLEQIANDTNKPENKEKALTLLLDIAKNPDSILQVAMRAASTVKKMGKPEMVSDLQSNAPNIFVREAASTRDISAIGKGGVFC